MQFSTAPSLLLGLTARLFIDKFISPRDPGVRDYVLFGLWEGVGLYYSYQNSSDLATIVTLAIGAKFFVDFEQDVTKCACTLLGVGLGVLCTDVLSKFIGDGLYVDPNTAAQTHSAPAKNERSVQFRSTDGEGGDSRRRNRHHRSRRQTQTVSDITSLDSTSDMWPNTNMSALDRQVAALRARASLADSERRRYKEEKKWAVAQGNHARASQMSWQVKRYAALMQSFHREADARVVEGEVLTIYWCMTFTNVFLYSASSARQAPVEPPPRPPSRDRNSRTQNHDIVNERHASAVNGDASGSHRRQQSANLKPAIRVHAR